jgi:hypothetical protein
LKILRNSYLTTTGGVADDSATLTFGYEHELQLGIYQLAHLTNQVPDLPLRPGAETFIRHVDQLPQVAREIQRCCTGIRQDIPGVLVGNTFCLVTVVPVSDSPHSVTQLNGMDSVRGYILEIILGAVPLTPLSEDAMPVSHQLMGTGPGNTFDLEGEVDVFKD